MTLDFESGQTAIKSDSALIDSIESPNENCQTLSATYSPEDNKLRLYSVGRLDEETYKRVRAHGFRYAPKQELFVAPMWTPQRADLLTELCGEIRDESNSLQDRAEQRAERFSGYQASRAQDAQSHADRATRLAERFQGGQPILVGHHSEIKARKDAEIMKREMRNSISMWETSEYWKDRVAGVIANASYKDKPEVRIRRIKKLQAQERKFQKTISESAKVIGLWTNKEKPLTLDRAKQITNCFDRTSRCFKLSEFPRDKDKSQYEGPMSLWSALEFISPEKAKEISLKAHGRVINHTTRWLEHTKLRINYELEILKSQGHTMPGKKPKTKASPATKLRTRRLSSHDECGME